MKFVWVLWTTFIVVNMDSLPKYIPGAIVAQEKKVEMVSEFITATINIGDLIQIPESLTHIGNNLGSIRENLRDLNRLKLTTVDQKLIIDNIQSQLNHSDEMIREAYSWFPRKQLNNRNKRGLVNLIGKGLNVLFGTATEDEVLDLRDKIADIEEIRRKNDRLIEDIYSTSKVQLDKINEIINDTNSLKLETIKVKSTVKINAQLTYVSHIVNRITLSLYELISKVQETFEAIVLALNGVVTPGLLSYSELLVVLNQAYTSFNLKPLFDQEDLFLYFSYITVQFAPSTIILHIPMATSYHFDHYSITPFPTFHYNQSIRLNDTKKHVLVSSHLQYYVETSSLEKCTAHGLLYICMSTQFPWLKFTNINSCMADILRQKFQDKIYDNCHYTVNNNKLQIEWADSFLFLYIPFNVMSSILCDDHAKLTSARNLRLLCTCTVENDMFRVQGISDQKLKLNKSWDLQYDIIAPINWSKPITVPTIAPLAENNKTFTILDHATTKIVVPFTALVTSSVSIVGIMALTCCLCRYRRNNVLGKKDAVKEGVSDQLIESTSGIPLPTICHTSQH